LSITKWKRPPQAENFWEYLGITQGETPAAGEKKYGFGHY
jgi:hypothetical protein